MCFSAPLTDPAFSCLERPCGQHSEVVAFTWECHVIALKDLPDTWWGVAGAQSQYG